MMRDDTRVRCAAVLAVFLVACGHGCPVPDMPGHMTFTDGARLTVRIADDDLERAQGLMGVEHLPADEGMAFLYGSPTVSTFWMKGTLIPLSIAFIGDNGRIVTIRDMEPCQTEPCPEYRAEEPFLMAIEVNRGWFEANAIDVGDRVKEFDGPFCY